MVYFVRTKAGGIHPLHENELRTYLRRGHQIVYGAQSLPPQKDTRYQWVGCWVAPGSQEAVEAALKSKGSKGYDTWQLSIAEIRVSYHPYREKKVKIRTEKGYHVEYHIRPVQNEPEERISTVPITSGRIWVRVPVEEVKQFIQHHLHSAYFEGFRVERDAQGNVPVVSAPRMPRERKAGPALLPGDVVYVPTKKTWGRFERYATDEHFVEIGPMHQLTRIQKSPNVVVPLTSCVLVPTD